MDFFQRQDQARRNTKWLVVYFALGVGTLIVILYAAAWLIFVGTTSRHRSYSYYEEPTQAPVRLWDPQLFSGVAVCTLAVIGLGSLFKTMELSQGGKAVADMLGGRPVSPATSDPDERKLLDIVEEMALASGVPVPQVYVLPEERGINAFAAGHSASDAVIAVTQGSMKLLNRDELQGVVGHEFSHILNGDMRMNLRLIGILFGLVCLAVIGRILLYTGYMGGGRRSSRDNSNALPIFGLALLAIGGIGVFFGRLIQAAVSRQREALADASSVQFTRNPAGLAGALKKIGGLSYGSKLDAPHAAEASHIFFGNDRAESAFHWLDTHPPLLERIRALEPEFDGKFPSVSAAPLETAAPARRRLAQAQPFPFPFPGHAPGQATLAGLTAPPIILAHSVMADAGTPTPAHIEYAAQLRDAIPPGLQTAAREPLGASALVYALLLSDDETVQSKQLKELASATSAGVCQETLRTLPQIDAIATRAKLPLLELALPGLRHLSPTQFQQFRNAIQALIEANGDMDLFEYVVQKMVLRHLEPHFVQMRKPVVQYYALKPLAPDCAVLLSALSHLSQQDPAQMQAAFEQGAQGLNSAAQVGLSFVPEEQCELSQVDSALNRLARAAPQLKKTVLSACARTVAAAGPIQESEAELLRAIADTLDCPLPPFISGV